MDQLQNYIFKLHPKRLRKTPKKNKNKFVLVRRKKQKKPSQRQRRLRIPKNKQTKAEQLEMKHQIIIDQMLRMLQQQQEKSNSRIQELQQKQQRDINALQRDDIPQEQQLKLQQKIQDRQKVIDQYTGYQQVQNQLQNMQKPEDLSKLYHQQQTKIEETEPIPLTRKCSSGVHEQQEEQKEEIKDEQEENIFSDQQQEQLQNLDDVLEKNLLNVTQSTIQLPQPKTDEEYAEEANEILNKYNAGKPRIEDIQRAYLKQFSKEMPTMKKADSIRYFVEKYVIMKRQQEGYGIPRDGDQDGTALDNAIQLLEVSMPKIYQLNVILSSHDDDIKCLKNQPMIIIFLKEQHYTVGVYKGKEYSEICYYNPLGFSKNTEERYTEDLRQLEQISSILEPEYFLKLKWNTNQTQDPSGDYQTNCFQFCYIFLHNYIINDMKFKYASQFTGYDEQEMEQLTSAQFNWV